MADQQTSAPWKESESQQGQKYQVSASHYDITDQSGDAPAANGPPFNVTVDWRLNTEGSPSQEIQDKTGITYYKLEEAPWYSPKKYRLTISTKDSYNYTFFDNEPDQYGLNVHRTNGLHWVEYDSRDPRITSITGK
ncbi:hypothetical protein NW761_014352 [Fusarium oxysporum]|uniref:Uncharacterized protein n=2 Tax=Fusarium oxysporum TaxID=5507 RepID=A0A8J5Q7B4_FUSOX|nr:hypothetical protein FOVG_15136 [Fusarium oxysporum f. sp. pisi HDV247]KAG7434747.1 hypothetical protein Forpi1262_v005483 [Fusarium oxysporum f. sp. raphani]KAJ4025801.1 hypothetical protein NW758_014539 [Fusarium oxysporum]KAJ4073313.1 hypothetical protein NW761_014352 [Fusarium oxysporum]